MKYFLYVRKSTDVEDKQVRSIEDQLVVLRALAKTEGFHIAEEFVEKQSAKVPGRPIFNDMLLRIEKGEAPGIVCWKLDRLARNPVDGGQISWFLQRGIIQHIQTHDRSYLPTDNVLMMSVEFGMANQYILDLSANTKRGLHEKAKRGEYPSLAPVGYLNDSRTKTIIVERKKAKIVRSAFELYAKGNSRLEDVSMFLSEHGIGSALANNIHKSRVSFMLSNPFYYGLFRYAGELHEGKHEPIISKKLFDKVQEILNARGKSKRKLKDPKPLCGLIRCGECGRMITAEVQRGHTYYRCTKRRMVCSQPYIREEALAIQLSATLETFAMPETWAVELIRLSDQDEQKAAQIAETASQAVKEEMVAISQKLQRLLNAYLDQDIEQENYRSEKAGLLSRKKSLEEKIANLKRGSIAWLEPMREWIKDASLLAETATNDDLSHKKVSLQKIFGSNLFLKNRHIEFIPLPPYAALRAARENFSENELSSLLVRVGGIEPPSHPWQGRVLPLNHTRPVLFWCPREESNLYYKIRNLASYPLNDEGSAAILSRVFKNSNTEPVNERVER